MSACFRKQLQGKLAPRSNPALAISMMLAQTELLRIETDIALSGHPPVEEDESVIHDLSPLGR